MKTSKKILGAGHRRRGRVKSGQVVVRVIVAVQEKQAAACLARDYSRRKLETVLAAFVADLAVAAERPGSWEHERVAGWLGSHVWECEPEDRPCR